MRDFDLLQLESGNKVWRWKRKKKKERMGQVEGTESNGESSDLGRSIDKIESFVMVEEEEKEVPEIEIEKPKEPVYVPKRELFVEFDPSETGEMLGASSLSLHSFLYYWNGKLVSFGNGEYGKRNILIIFSFKNSFFKDNLELETKKTGEKRKI